MIKKMLLLLVILTVTITSCSDDQWNAEKETKYITSILKNDPELSLFREAFEKIDLNEYEETKGLTIFAVKNEALSSVRSTAPSMNQELLEHHIGQGYFTPEIFRELIEVYAPEPVGIGTIDGGSLTIEFEGDDIFVNGILLDLSKTYTSGNVSVYVINKVLPTEYEPVPKKRIRSLENNTNNQYINFVYNDKGRLIQYRENHDDNEYNLHTLEYKDGKLVKQERQIGGNIERQIGGNIVDIKREYKHINTTTIHVITITIDPSTLKESVDKEILTIDPVTQQLLKQTNEFGTIVKIYQYDAKRNLSSMNDEGSITSFSYDDKRSMLSNQGLPAWFWVYDGQENFDLFTGVNNVVSEVWNGSTYIYSYLYDDYGYPTQMEDADADCTYSIYYEEFR